MLNLTVDLHLVGRQDTARAEVILHSGYGSDAEVANQLLQLALGAEWPLVLDSSGQLVRFEAGSVRQFYVRKAAS